MTATLKSRKATTPHVSFEVRRAVEDVAGIRVEEVLYESNLEHDLHLDSNARMDLLELLEERFQIEFSDREDMAIETVEDIAISITNKLEKNNEQ